MQSESLQNACYAQCHTCCTWSYGCVYNRGHVATRLTCPAANISRLQVRDRCDAETLGPPHLASSLHLRIGQNDQKLTEYAKFSHGLVRPLHAAEPHSRHRDQVCKSNHQHRSSWCSWMITCRVGRRVGDREREQHTFPRSSMTPDRRPSASSVCTRVMASCMHPSFNCPDSQQAPKTMLTLKGCQVCVNRSTSHLNQ